MLRACRDRKVRRMVLASTSDCYGRNPEVPFSEDSVSVIGSPQVRRWSYAVSKMFEEQALFAFRERHGLEGVALRLFGGYGPRQNMTWWGGPQSVFIGAALKGEALEVHGTGRQTRSFTYVDDMVDGFVRAVDVPAADGEMLNIGSDREITIEDLARMVWRLVRDDEPRINLVPFATFGRYEDVERRIPDNRWPRGSWATSPRVTARGGPAPHDRLAARGHAQGRPLVIHVVVPAFNEAGNIERLPRAGSASAWSRWRLPHRIVVVDDGSTDGTAEARAGAVGRRRGPSRSSSHPPEPRPGRRLPHRLPPRAARRGSPRRRRHPRGRHHQRPVRSCRACCTASGRRATTSSLASCYLYGGGIEGTRLHRVGL